MVSFWPWKNDETSPASFEKALSTLSAKITKTNSKLDGLRQRSRRLNLVWILYAGFAYLLCLVILILVVGWRKWSAAEYTGIALGPGIIYLGRQILMTYYDYRTSKVQSHLDDLERQRNQTIDKLKAATKYNSTQELLKKYGGSPTPKDRPSKKAEGQGTSRQGQQATSQGGRTNIVPPPTANIPGRRESYSPQGAQRPPLLPPSAPDHPDSSPPLSPTADFAPNAFSTTPQYAQTKEGPKWYDRLIDVLLGEDESLPGKRIALICSKCRLVNGQAPPGTQSLHDVGKWQCMGCGTMNGEENEVERIVTSIEAEQGPRPDSASIGSKFKAEEAAKDDEEEGSESDVTQYSTDDDNENAKEDEESEEETERSIPQAKPTGRPTRRSNRVKLKAQNH